MATIMINGIEFGEGDRIRIIKDGRKYEGIMMPSRSGNVVVKMNNGYNAGILVDENASIELIEKYKGPVKAPAKEHAKKEGLPRVSILSTGGTIASKVDYRTGAVSSQFTADDILDAIPELSDIATYKGEVLSMIFSEDMTPATWSDLARAVHKEIKEGADGVIITHGTDTMSYTAAALSFMVQSPVPIVLVGSQRSADRPSSDNAMNAICAATVATSDMAGVFIVMHGTTSDDSCAVHRGTKVRKSHTSTRTAFASINDKPVAYVDYQTKKITASKSHDMRGEKDLILRDRIDDRCALVKFYPGMSPDILEYYRSKGFKGIVLEGTGLGHVSTKWINDIKKAIDSGMVIVMTSQCINGRICDRVYSTGIDLLNSGVIEGEDMLPEVALVKLMWAFGQSDDLEEVEKIMKTNIAGEINWRSTI